MAFPKTTTIDGPAGSGKSTKAQWLAAAMSGIGIDSGSIYRIIANELLLCDISPTDAEMIEEHIGHLDIDIENGIATHIGGLFIPYKRLKSLAVTQVVSATSRNLFIRNKVNGLIQQYVAGLDVPVVCEGRDAATVILPDAECKIYLYTSPEIRSLRTGYTLADIKARDISDMTTKGTGNLISLEEAQAASYHIVDSCGTDEEVQQALLEIVSQY